MRNLLTFIIFLAAVLSAHGEDDVTDSLNQRHWGYNISISPGRQTALDEYTRQWLQGKKTWTLGTELTYQPQPDDGDDFARDYNYPRLAAGVRYDFNHGTTMHRYPSPSWGEAREVDYHSHLGDAVTLYGSFARPIFRTRHWQMDYVMRIGFSYSSLIYNKKDNIDNEFIGSHINIFFGAALLASWRFADEWALQGGLEFRHHSNGALRRPNKGENAVGPTIGLAYMPPVIGNRQQAQHAAPFTKKWYGSLTVGLGAKTLNEEWQRTQFRTPYGDPDYRTEHFKVYAAYSLQADVMVRYARRWASGIGADIFYGTYWKRVREIDEMQGNDVSHSPWSVGIAAKHEVFWHQLSLAMSLGFYLHRQMGFNAKQVEQPYYERIGLRYHFPRLGGLFVGTNINAHKTKADLTEIVVGFPIGFNK